MKDHLSFVLLILMLLLCSLTFASAEGSPSTKPKQKNKYCGWELMQNLNIPIGVLGTLYAKQTADRSLCTRQDDGSEYCTCIYECGNGVWSYGHRDEQSDQVRPWVWEEGCNKYCHAGVCDGQR